MAEKFEMEFGGRTLSIETGSVAKQAHGSVWMQAAEKNRQAVLISGPSGPLVRWPVRHPAATPRPSDDWPLGGQRSLDLVRKFRVFELARAPQLMPRRR